MKNKKLNSIILFIALALVLYFTLKDDFNSIIRELKKVNIIIFIISIIVFLLALLFKSASLKLFINEHDKSYSLKNTFELTLIGQFLNGITPFQSGGQPFQIYLLKKDGIRITDSTKAMIKDFISFQCSLILMGIFSIIVNKNVNVLSQKGYLNWLIFLGFGINVIVLLFLLLLYLAKKTGTKITFKIIDFIFKFKIVNKLNITKESLKQSLSHFYDGASDIKSNKLLFFKTVVLNSMYLVLLYLIPFVLFKSVGVKISVLESIIATTFVMLIGNFIPIPGATGGIEYGFMQFFGSFIKGPVLSGTMILWRIVTYFLGMIIGFVVLLFKKEVKKDEDRIVF